MIAHKHITKIVAVIMAIAVCLCLCAMVFSNELVSAVGGTGVTMEYETALFDTDEVISVNIIMDDADWEDMLANASAEAYYQCDVEINGETFYRVGIRPKGNTSLTSIASDPDTDRYSLKLEFDQYVDGQTCYGLDKLILNNNYADATNMKEALIFDMYQHLDADASLYNYAEISVNGEYWGVYLALEAVEDSFLLRNYGTESGELYKPDSMNMDNIGGGNFDASNMEDFDFSQFEGMTPPDSGSTPGADDDSSASEESADAGSSSDAMPDFSGGSGGGMFGGFSMGGSGANLNYTDDDLDSYSTIWEGEVTNTTDADHRRVVTALKNISEGVELEEYMDVDNLLKYMAVHVFSVNEDSLSGMMAHNYYLYESDGQLNILPWDYNLALGGMSGTDATSVVNDAIDNAFSGTEFFDTLMENEEYQAQFYAYLQQLVDEYLLGDGFEEFYTRTRSQIDSLVETDPTAFYTYDEYVTAAETFYEVVKLRGESISGQIEGTIPSTESEQRGSDALIDASDIDLSVMGSMSMGDGMRDFMDDDSTTAQTDGSGSTVSVDSANPSPSDQPNSSNDSSASDVSPSGDVPEDFDPSQFDGEIPEGFDASQFTGNTQTDGQSEEAGSQESSGESQDRSVMPNDFDMSNIPGTSSDSGSSSMSSNLVTYGVCFAVLLLALLFVMLYKRKPRRR